jgi:hypothetical protein
MSFLTWYGEHAPIRDAPKRVYGRVDAREPPDGEPDSERTILIDSVDADWFDEVAGNLRWFGAHELSEDLDGRVSVVELETGGRRGGPPEERSGEGAWVELEFTEGEALAHYLNLFGAPLMRGYTGWWPIAPAVQDRLEQLTGFGDLHDAHEDELQTVLRGAGLADAVAVYDVGHGNCNALIDGARPSLYFDFGGGVLRNRATFPAALQRFCMTAEPVIVLSHWDFDHWSSARRDTSALNRTWIVPRQPIGPSHTAFLGQIHAGGRILVWPAGLASISLGMLTIEACTGPQSSRNDSGLAVSIERSDGSRMLLPADCGYDHVPNAVGPFASVTVPHHGGRSPSAIVPASDGRASGRCVYSLGAANSYGHPLAATEQLHRLAWPHELRTDRRGPSGLGHVHLYWDSHDPTANLGCAGTGCDLGCEQR